jgi:outer membrane translocation and assembly module TamA
VKKNLGDDQHLINRYRISIDGNNPSISSSELRTLISPEPNSKFLFFRIKLWSYYRYQKNPSKFNIWLNKHFGEEPAIYNETNLDVISKKMMRYLNNIGYFDSKVEFQTNFKHKAANIRFLIKPSIPYKISQIKYSISDTLIKKYIDSDIKNTLIKKGDIYNAYTFDNERDRITANLRNNGYYYFNRNYIQFIVDSNLMKRDMVVDLVINNVKKQDQQSRGEFIEQNHKRYFINNVTVIPEFDPNLDLEYDTIKHKIEFWNDTNNYTYYFLYNSKKHLRPSAFNSAIKIKPGQPYSAINVQTTYRKLFNYQIIQTANISFDTTNTPVCNESNHDYLNSRIQLKDSKLNRYSTEIEGTNSSGDLGIRGNLVFLNKNIFRRAEVFRIRLKGGVEAQTISEPTENDNGLFNTFEAGIDGTFFFPRFLSPVRFDKFNQEYIPNTNLNFGFNYQQRPNYSRNITNVDIGYIWKSGKSVNHILTPININYVNINPTPEFDSVLENEPNRRLREQYADHMIVGLKYSYIFNNQNMMSLQHFNYLRINLESSGNLLYGINSLIGTQKADSGYYEVLGVRYSQYLRSSIDFRHYYYFSKKTNSLVWRILLGAGIPFFNSDELPYEKGFYAGGANDMRGWLFKDLGPGGYSGDSQYEKVGDIQIEGNLEYRFPIYGFFKGAIFTDIGNIWTYNKSATFPDGQFHFDTFISQLAVDAGIGFRFDFQVLIFRIDVAAPIRNPAYPSGHKWRYKYLQPVDFIWNFGIGYPF